MENPLKIRWFPMDTSPKNHLKALFPLPENIGALGIFVAGKHGKTKNTYENIEPEHFSQEWNPRFWASNPNIQSHWWFNSSCVAKNEVKHVLMKTSQIHNWPTKLSVISCLCFMIKAPIFNDFDGRRACAVLFRSSQALALLAWDRQNWPKGVRPMCW